MNLKHLAATAAVLAASSPAIASAAPAAPVVIADTLIAPSYGIQNNFAYPGLVTVSFVNHRNVAVKEVDFALQSDGVTIDRFADVGTFAPNVTVRHSFQTQAENFTQNVTVASVTFADGTTWSNDDASPRALRQADVSYVGDFLTR